MEEQLEGGTQIPNSTSSTVSKKHDGGNPFRVSLHPSRLQQPSGGVFYALNQIGDFSAGIRFGKFDRETRGRRIYHSFMNVHAGRNGHVGILLLMDKGLPIELASDIIIYDIEHVGSQVMANKRAWVMLK
eukprot:2306905-Prymnesium_polylepis.1